jgi:hypothetical protein
LFVQLIISIQMIKGLPYDHVADVAADAALWPTFDVTQRFVLRTDARLLVSIGRIERRLMTSVLIPGQFSAAKAYVTPLKVTIVTSSPLCSILACQVEW